MNTDTFSDLSRLSDQELLARVELLAHREREATAALIAHLAVLDERGLYLAEGCSSMFTYCTQVLHYSEYAAINRIETARAARRFPIILEMLADGSVNLTAVRLLAPDLTPANHREVLEVARHKGKRQVLELKAHLRPQPAVPSAVRKLPSAITPPQPDTLPVAASADVPALPPPPIATLLPARPVVVPLAPERYKVQFTASAEMREKLQYAQDLLRHQIPNGDIAQVMDLALTALIKNLEREKFGATSRPRASRDVALDSRYIPSEVKRKVWARDGGRCAFRARNGRRCTERAFLEFHHLVPYAAGGEATTDNIQLRCRAHNGYESELYFGRRMPAVVREARAAYWHFARGGTAETRTRDRVPAIPRNVPPHAHPLPVRGR